MSTEANTLEACGPSSSLANQTNQHVSNQSIVTVEPGHKGTVSGVTAALFHQRATISIQNAAGRVLMLITLEADPTSQVLSFGPFNELVTINVLIENSEKGDNFSVSKVKPLNVSKQADASNPVHYLVSTILSEDHVDDNYNDCIITIF
ncbi:hypothetical protein C0995_008296 [Termitomyces sp. Mi166|nr:hypothetical protein C0995_008296 [Termitomyces sp. Mi166\